MRRLVTYISILLVFENCKTRENLKWEEVEITGKITELYTLYGKTANSVYDHPIPKDVFTADFEMIFAKAMEISEADTERIKKSRYPTDKPMLLEGAIFTSLYEGYKLCFGMFCNSICYSMPVVKLCQNCDRDNDTLAT